MAGRPIDDRQVETRCGSETSPTSRPRRRQAARRRAGPRPRADAGAALGHPAARPPRRRRGEGRAARRAATGPRRRCRRWPTPRAARSAPPSCATTSTSGRSASTSRRRPAATSSCGSRPGSTSSPRTSRRARSTAWASATTDIAAVHPAGIYLSVSGFGNTGDSPYGEWPAYAPIVEAMSGIYEFKRQGDDPPLVAPVGALGDIGTGPVRRHRRARRAAPPRPHRAGPVRRRRHARLDGRHDRPRHQLLVDGPAGRRARAADHARLPGVGRLVHHPGRSRAPVRPAGRAHRPPRVGRRRALRHPAGLARPPRGRTSARPSRRGRRRRTTVEACQALGTAGVAAGPCFSDEQIVHDPHVAARNMLVEMPRTDGVDQPVLVPGNPVKMSDVAEGPETRVPWLGEHTDEVLAAELGLTDAELAELRPRTASSPDARIRREGHRWRIPARHRPSASSSRSRRGRRRRRRGSGGRG